MKEKGYDISKNYTDCGVEIFNPNTQDTHAGGSGCGCSAVVFNGHILKEMKKGRLRGSYLWPQEPYTQPL